MVLLGLGLLIASVSFLCYKHSPATWWAFLDRLRPVASIQDGGKEEKKGRDGKGEDIDTVPGIILNKEAKDKVKDLFANAPNEWIEGNGENINTVPGTISNQEARNEVKDSSADAPTSSNEYETEKNAKMEEFTNAPSFQITEAAPEDTTTAKITGNETTPQPNKAALDRAAMPPPQIPSFPAANSAQRASGGARSAPRLNPLPSFTPSLSTPSRGPIPNRSPLPSLAPPPTHASIPTKPPKKVLLLPNHSPLDWARLTSSPNSNLRNLPPSTPLLRVPPSLLKQFTGRKGKDAWTVLGGKVYNITPYIPYHPGGEPELMRCAGRDGTRMFAEVHPWVNWEGMLEACLVGISVGESDVEGSGGLEDMD